MLNRNYFLASAIGCLVSLVIISCASTPSGPDQALLDSLNEVLARAEGARKRVNDFGGPEFFGAETAAAEGQYQSAAKIDTNGDLEEAMARYTQAAAAFEKIFEKTLPLYAKVWWDELTEARNEAIDLGIVELAYDRFVLAAEAAEAAYALYEKADLRSANQGAGDYYAARDAARQAMYRFKVLDWLAEAHKFREEIKFYNIGQDDSENSAIAQELFDAAAVSYDAGNIGGALDASGKSLQKYDLILNAGMQSRALEQKAVAEEARRSAVSVKADKAVKNEFAVAGDVFDLADSSLRKERYYDAFKLYFQAESAFTATAAAVEEKRLKAEEAMRLAAEKVTASEILARNAELVLQGSVQ
ncbi:hypothetical protein AGMMS50267_17330 [Spirochaetia bacterium]|nr:hypothetical protein AGMMS50267_17330 [Spirochaetia bacterium]